MNKPLTTGLVEQAREWLAGALCHAGAGARTNAGYGAFQLDATRAELKQLAEKVAGTWRSATKASADRTDFTCTLELVTPAFLSGADQEDPAGCDLRLATLRGQLRWWWRTMHAGHVDTATLRRMEAAIWGDTKQGGAVRIEVKPAADSPTRHLKQFEKREYETVARHEKITDYGIPAATDPNKITPGVAYLAYGMDELVKHWDGTKRPRRRWCLLPGQRWSVSISSRGWGTTESEHVLEQAKAALFPHSPLKSAVRIRYLFTMIARHARNIAGTSRGGRRGLGLLPGEGRDNSAAIRFATAPPTRPTYDDSRSVNFPAGQWGMKSWHWHIQLTAYGSRKRVGDLAVPWHGAAAAIGGILKNRVATALAN